MHALLLAIAPWGRRMRLQRCAEAAVWCLAVAAPVASIAWGFEVALWPAVLLAVPVATVAGWFWELDDGRAARFADRTAELNAGADTALHLARSAHPAAEAVALDALDALQGKTPPKLTPPRGRVPLLAAVALALLLAPLVRWLQPEDEAVEPAPSELLETLDAIEADARRKGQTELVEAVRQLRERVQRVKAAQQAAPEAVVEQRAAPSQSAPDAPPPPQTPEPAGELPDDFDTPEEFQQALEAAHTAMASDDEMLRQFGEEVERQLYEITAFQELGQDLMGETLRANQEMNRFEEAEFSSMTRFGDGATSALNEQAGGRFAEAAVDPTDLQTSSGYRENEMDDPQHDLMHGLQETYKEFLEAYANAMRDELMEAIHEDAQAPSSTANDDGNLSMGEDIGGKGGAQKDNISGDANLEVRDAKESGGARLASLDSEHTKQVSGGNIETPGTSTKKGGKGGGLSGSGEGTDKDHVGEDGEAGGGTERVEGEFGPGNLTDRERDTLHQAMAGKSVATGPGSEFDSSFTGYFDEVERALIEEDMPPMMQSVVVAYFNGLQKAQ